MKLKSLIGAALVAGTLLSGTAMASVASAAPEPSGWDDVNNQVTGGGSDTTYNFMQRAETLYNQANGCDTDNVSGSATLGQCLTGAAQSSTNVLGNWDHDFFVSKYPTGSSAGVRALQLGQVDYARSSRGPRSTGETDLDFWAFGKDALVMVTFDDTTDSITRLPGNLTKAQIVSIYNCTTTNWSQLGLQAGVIEPIGMNPASGTKASMDTYLGTDANSGACVKKLANGTFPFENDAKQITDAANIIEGNAIWWMSYAEYTAFSYKRQNAQVWSVDGVGASAGTIASNAYPITRFVFHVTLDSITAVNDPVNKPSDILGPDAGAQGAVRELTEFMCKPEVSHTRNDYSGKTNYAELGSIYTATGFIRVPSGERTNGICKLVAG